MKPGPELRIVPFAAHMVDDLADLFASDGSAHACWCMWFITSVKEHHAGGAQGNRRWFEALARESVEPMGLLAYQGGRAVAWCAVGPKERFARAVRTPTMKAHSSTEGTWFVPCFFVRGDARRSGVTRALLDRAVELATAHGAKRIEGFPAAGSRPATSGDRQVGTEGVFCACGFEPIGRPSAKRVVMLRRVGNP